MKDHRMLTKHAGTSVAFYVGLGDQFDDDRRLIAVAEDAAGASPSAARGDSALRVHLGRPRLGAPSESFLKNAMMRTHQSSEKMFG
jgi:hypothetical protein